MTTSVKQSKLQSCGQTIFKISTLQLLPRNSPPWLYKTFFITYNLYLNQVKDRFYNFEYITAHCSLVFRKLFRSTVIFPLSFPWRDRSLFTGRTGLNKKRTGYRKNIYKPDGGMKFLIKRNDGVYKKFLLISIVYTVFFKGSIQSKLCSIFLSLHIPYFHLMSTHHLQNSVFPFPRVSPFMNH